MTDTSEHAEAIQALVSSQRFAVLATRQDDGHPYASLVAFCASSDLQQMVFCTLRATRKFANLEAEGRVALLIDNRANDEADLQQAAAVTVVGACTEAHGEEGAGLRDCFLARHPTLAEFVKSPGCAVMKVEVRSYYLVTRFQSVVEVQVRRA